MSQFSEDVTFKKRVPVFMGIVKLVLVVAGGGSQLFEGSDGFPCGSLKKFEFG